MQMAEVVHRRSVLIQRGLLRPHFLRLQLSRAPVILLVDGPHRQAQRHLWRVTPHLRPQLSTRFGLVELTTFDS